MQHKHWTLAEHFTNGLFYAMHGLTQKRSLVSCDLTPEAAVA